MANFSGFIIISLKNDGNVTKKLYICRQNLYNNH